MVSLRAYAQAVQFKKNWTNSLSQSNARKNDVIEISQSAKSVASAL